MYSVVPSGVYSVPDIRFTRQGLYAERPISFLRPGLPITSINMLPYQAAGSSVPFGYTLVPNSMVPQQRVMYSQPSIRTNYIDLDDEDVEEYVPIKPRKRTQDVINEIMDSPEMDEFTAQTRQIRKDANAVLQRLNTPKPSSRASDFFKSYDYDTRPLVQRYPSPLPERASTRTRSPYLEEEDEPGCSRRFRGLSSYPSSVRPFGISTLSLTKDRIRNVYSDLDEPASYKTPKSYDFSHTNHGSLLSSPSSVGSEINRKAMLKEPSRAIGRSYSLRTPRRDASDVKNNISIRAQYAAMREAATRDVNIRKPKEIMP